MPTLRALRTSRKHSQSRRIVTKHTQHRLRHCALTFYLNGADFGGPGGPPANVNRFKLHDQRGGGTQLAWRVVADVPEGAELLASYTAGL